MKKKEHSLVRVFFRTFSLLLLFTIILINYRSSIQPYSFFSIANAMTHIEPRHFNSIGLVKDLAYFVGILTLIHIFWAFVIIVSFQAIKNSNRSELNNDLFWLILVLLHLTLVVSLNSHYFPTSLTSYFRATILSSPSSIALQSLVLLTLFIIGLKRSKHKTVVSITTIALTSLCLYPLISKNTDEFFYNDKPNIIIIGIDGLRPDHLNYDSAQSDYAPFINALLSESQNYINSYSPQGRTYVAWMSILTGLYPKNNGARFNLAPPELINKKLPLVEKLKSRGYHTAYAMDERRFNQIDKAYGFDSEVGPMIGAADAFISSFSDLPYINLMLKHPYSKYLFPYLYNNRAYGKTYNPKAFNDEVIESLNTKKPNFLAVHFCQLHWPYTSIDFIEHTPEEWEGNYSHFMYKSMLKKVDDQLRTFFEQMKNKGFLKNSIVYLISDHGEGFKLKQSKRFTTPINGPDTQSWGHGTNVLDQQQAKVVLAKLRYRDDKVINKPIKIDGLYSLIDILPSLDDELNLDLIVKFDGIILPDLTLVKPSNRHIFVESSLPLKSINASFVDEKKVVSETASSYEVRPSGRAVMKPEEYKNLLSRKQRSIYQGDFQLAMLPDKNMITLLNFDSNELSIIAADIEPKSDKVKALLLKLCNFYKTDYGFDSENRCNDISDKSDEDNHG
ncbi:sulfatase-like hydrolase/transferase [Shewanella abyssi]|uniref:sulfatase-like hydrolase/transferase n=1 Tax=Shewanella abyssi TaxID=311789 RepID=UPI00200D122F|nr:sulfatase-like hydrolase/transferase [Shewanella abyssi]MCL1048192.1 sulfatase-like hydrolase/transferase [Shewanella abyssi]